VSLLSGRVYGIITPHEYTLRMRSMAEEFLTLMADLDDDTQARMAAWYDALKKEGFIGEQTPGLSYHISLASFPLDQEQEAIALAREAAEHFAPFPVHFSHVGLFAGGRVLFIAPERCPELDALHGACERHPDPKRPWTPHMTLLIDAPDGVCAALPPLIGQFRPFVGKIVRLHLCAFWPTREIGTYALE